MKKTIIILLVSIFVIIAGMIISFSMLFGSSDVDAYLKVREGNVQVSSNTQEWNTAEDGMELSMSDSIRTNQGVASVIILDSIIIDLEPETEISLQNIAEDNVKVLQNKGSTWNKLANVIGMDSFEVETPNSVATVRGTEFGVDLNSTNDSSVSVIEGEVEVSSENDTKKVKQFEKADVKNNNIEKKEFTEEEKEKAKKKVEKTLNNMKDLRQDIINRHQRVLNIVKNKYDLSDEDIEKGLDKIDKGEVNVDDHIDKLPFKINSMDKLLKLNEKIKEQQKLLDSLSQ